MLAQQDEHQAILRRREREAEKQSERAVFPLLRDLLPALDALEQAQQSTLHPETSPHDLAQGIGLLQHTFLQAFAQHEIHPIQPTRGTLFDPNAHESIGLIDDPTLPPNTIAQTLRTGWRVRDALLRPATVQTTHPTVQTTHTTAKTTHPTAQTTHSTAQTTHPTAQTTKHTVQTTEYIEHTNHTSSQSAQPNEQITHPNEDLGT
jgi:hypothetical protein